MIAKHSADGIEQLFVRSIKASFALREGDTCEILQVAQNKSLDLQEKKSVIFTISSFSFRLLIIFHYTDSAAISAYFCGESKENELKDVFFEVGNMCCGTVDHSLSPYFTHLGMSTPYMLSTQSIPFLIEMTPDLLSSYKIVINECIEFHGTLCMYTQEKIDFTIAEPSHSEDSGGLEMF